MNYRHAFHAGNFADVLKHLVLTLVITHMAKKSAPFRVIDTHAGTGLYDLGGEEAEKTGEWRHGIARVLSARQALPADVRRVLAPTSTSWKVISMRRVAMVDVWCATPAVRWLRGA